jgi:hypothetical protein
MRGPALGFLTTTLPPSWPQGLKTALQIGRYLVRAFEAGFEAGVKPIDAGIVETVFGVFRTLCDGGCQSSATGKPSEQSQRPIELGILCRRHRLQLEIVGYREAGALLL